MSQQEEPLQGVFSVTNKIKYIWDNLERYLMIFFFIVFFLNVFMQIASRVFFNNPFRFTEELSRYCFVWMVFLGMSFGTRYNKHIKIDVVVSMMPEMVRLIINIFIDILTLAVFTWIIFQGLEYVQYSSTNNIYTLPINKGVIVSILPITGLLVVIRCLEKIYIDFKKYTKGAQS